MGVSEIVSAAVEPANKLIDAVTGAIGKAYEPRHIRKKADAKAYEIKTIGEELRNNSDLPIVYESSGDYLIDISDYESLAKRAGKRIAYQEVEKQENIEFIIDNAYESLQLVNECKDGEISREWMHRFIDSAGNISTEELQLLWSKVLAGEVLDPKSFSLRTLECLRNLDVKDARLFEKICKVVISNQFVLNDNQFLGKYGITYSDILELDECGLINSSGTISFNRELDTQYSMIFDFKDYILLGKENKKRKIVIMEFPLTVAGKELSRVVGTEYSFDIIKDMCTSIKKKNNDIDLSLHKVNDRGIDNSISYELDSISIDEE